MNVNGACAAKAGDRAGCPGKFILTGSGSVNINGLRAARATDLTTDGAILLGSNDVYIGGPRAGATTGASAEQTAACMRAADGRGSHAIKQSYGNCALESWRNAINRRRRAEGAPPISEDDLLQEAIAKNIAVNDPGNHDHGACPDVTPLLASHGIQAEQKPASIGAIRDAVESGHAVSLTLHPYHWGPYVTDAWWHELSVTGIVYDDNGQVTGVVVNDTGAWDGNCGMVLSLDQLNHDAPTTMTVSKDPQW